MRKLVLLLTIATLICSDGLAAGTEYYKLSGVKRVDQDLYKTSSGIYIQTRYCYHYTYGEDAVLRWEFPGSIDNRIIWSDDSACAVERAWK